MVDKAALLETLLEVLIFVARMFFYTVVVVVAVLAVDVVALLLLNLLWNVDVWLDLLFWEGIIMMAVGAGGWWHGERPLPWSTPMGKRLYKIKVIFQYPWFGISVGIAGLVMWVLFAYLYLHT